MFLSPYCRGWDDRKYKQLAQTLIFDFAQLAGAKGGQVSFTDFNVYGVTPNFYKNTYAVGKNGCYMFENPNKQIAYIYDRNEMENYSSTHEGKILTYKDFEYEAQKICKAFLDVTKEGDSRGMPFGFPKIHFHINDELFENERGKELYDYCCEVLSKTGNPYIDFDRNAASMSQCCRLTIEFDNEDMELTKTPEELRFCGGQNVSINLANIPLCTNNEEEFYKELSSRMDMCAEMHKVKLNYTKSIADEPNSSLSFYNKGSDGKPYIKWDKISWLIGLVGLNECVYNLTGKQLHESKSAFLKGLEIICFMNDYCHKLSKQHNMNIKLEETPAESTAGRFAKLDKKNYGDKAYTKGEGNGVYYTNSVHFPVDAHIDYVDEIMYQSLFHSLVEAGSMIHLWIGDKSPAVKAIQTLEKNIWDKTKCVENTVSPNQTTCNSCCTTVNGFYDNCPNCNSDDVVQIAKITGYQARVDMFNESKMQELKDRMTHDLNGENIQTEFLVDDLTENSDKIKVYSTKFCPNCTKIKSYFYDNGIEYDEVDAKMNMSAKARLIFENKLSLPVIQKGKILLEYDANNSEESINQIMNLIKGE